MSNLTVANGETLRLHKALTSADTITVEAGGRLIADRLTFIEPAADIVVQTSTAGRALPSGELIVEHMPPVVRADYSSQSLVLHFASGDAATLHTQGTSVFADLHPEQVVRAGSSNSTFIFGPPIGTGFDLPPHVTSVPTNFIL